MIKSNRIINIILKFTAIITVFCSVLLCYVFVDLNVFPNKYIYYLIGSLVVINTLVLVSVSLKKTKQRIVMLQTILCTILSGLMICACIKIPDYKGKFERVFVELPETSLLNMNIYVDKDNDSSDIRDLIGKKIGVQTKLDLEHQKTALEDIKNQVKKRGEIDIVEYEDIYFLTEAFYNNEIDAMLLTDIYADIVGDNTDFRDFKEKTKVLYTVTQEIVDKHIQDAIPSVINTPFIIGLAGNDSWDYSYIMDNNGRTDTNIVAIVNPIVKKVLLVTVTRDAYLPINGELDKMDRLTNSATMGVEAWKNTLEYLLDTDIHYYMRISFPSFVNVIDYVGGIDIYNKEDFYCNRGLGLGGSGQYHFTIGNLHLSGSEAMAYARERKSFPDGDFTRNRHDALLFEALTKKIMSKNVLMNLDGFLNAVQGTFVTDMPMDDIYKLVKMQLEDNAEWSFETCNIIGEVAMDYSYTNGGGQGSNYMYVVYVDESTVENAKTKIQALLLEDDYDLRNQ